MSDSESSEYHLIDNTTQSTSLRQCDGAMPNCSQPSFPDVIASNVGMLFIISAQLFSACMYVSVKILNSLETPVHALQVIIIRMAVTFMCCVIYMIIMRIPDPITGPKDVRSLLIIRGITGFFGLYGVYLALQHLSVADATVLIFLTPLTTAVAGSILLKESYSANQAVAGVCSLLGVVLVTRPPFLFGFIPGISDGGHMPEGTPAERLAAVGACMMSVLGNTGAYTSIRAIGKRAHPMHVLTFFSLWCTIISSLWMSVSNIPVVYPTPWGWVLLLIVGVFGFVTQTLLTMGLQRETVSRGVTGMYTQVLFAVMLERLIFGVMPSLLSIVGAAIIMSSALYVVMDKQKTAQDSTSDNTA